MFKPNELSETQKRTLLSVVLVVAVGASLLSGLMFHDTTSMGVKVDVVNHSDPGDVHRVTSLTIEVENTKPRPIVPVFQATHGALQTVFSWETTRGPKVLNASETGRYELRAPVPAAGIPYEETAVLSVSDRGTNRMQKSTIRYNASTPEPVLNPNLGFWQKNPNHVYFEPYRWSDATSNHGSEATEIDHEADAAILSVSNVTRESGPWAMAGISQQIAFPERLHVEATPRTVVEEPVEYPPRAAGVELGEDDHRVWVVFANVSERQVRYRPGELSYILVYVPATPGERVETTVNITQLYDRYNWQRPEPGTREIDGIAYETRTANLLAFAAVYPGHSTETSAIEFERLEADTFRNETNFETTRAMRAD